METLSTERRTGLLRLRDAVIADCQGREESETLDDRLRLAATLDQCAENLAGQSRGVDIAAVRGRVSP